MIAVPVHRNHPHVADSSCGAAAKRCTERRVPLVKDCPPLFIRWKSNSRTHCPGYRHVFV